MKKNIKIEADFSGTVPVEELKSLKKLKVNKNDPSWKLETMFYLMDVKEQVLDLSFFANMINMYLKKNGFDLKGKKVSSVYKYAKHSVLYDNSTVQNFYFLFKPTDNKMPYFVIDFISDIQTITKTPFSRYGMWMIKRSTDENTIIEYLMSRN